MLREFAKYVTLGALVTAMPALVLATGAGGPLNLIIYPTCCTRCSACTDCGCCCKACNDQCTGDALETCKDDCNTDYGGVGCVPNC